MRRISETDIVVTADDRIPASTDGGQKPKAKAKARRAQPDARTAGEPKPTKTKRRVRTPRFDLTPLQKMAAGGVAVTALVVGGAVLWQSGFLQRTTATAIASVLTATVKAGFKVDDIIITGRSRTDMTDVAQALGAQHGSPILSIDLTQVKNRLEALASIKSAAIERHLPDALHISLTERQPIAVWQNGGTYALVDQDGKAVPGPLDPGHSLPLVVGDGAGLRAAEILALLATEPDLAPRVRAMIRVGNRRWNLMIDNAKTGLEVRLPEDDAKAAWSRFAELEREQSFTTRHVTMVDMRAPDRLILKTERPASPPESEKHKDKGA